MPLSPPSREQIAKAGSTAREAARPMKPTGADIVLLVVWALVLLFAVGATSMRLATGEGWLAKVGVTLFGGEIPFDLVKDRDRPIAVGEVAPGLGASLLLMFVPVLAAAGLGVGRRGWTIAAWVCLIAALPLAFDRRHQHRHAVGEGRLGGVRGRRRLGRVRWRARPRRSGARRARARRLARAPTARSRRGIDNPASCPTDRSNLNFASTR